MSCNVKLVTKKSKNGNEYTVLVLQFPDGYEKLVFLNPAELHLFKSYGL